MCFNVPHKYFWNSDNDSDTMDTNWQEMFNVYLLKIEYETKATLKMMNDDIERNGLTFNQKLKDSLLQFTNARISQAYEEFITFTVNEVQLFVECSEKDRSNVESGSKLMASDVFDRGVVIAEQNGDQLANGNSSTVEKSMVSKSNTSNENPTGLNDGSVASDVIAETVGNDKKCSHKSSETISASAANPGETVNDDLSDGGNACHLAKPSSKDQGTSTEQPANNNLNFDLDSSSSFFTEEGDTTWSVSEFGTEWESFNEECYDDFFEKVESMSNPSLDIAEPVSEPIQPIGYDQKPSHWASITYFELNEQVGETFNVDSPSVIVDGLSNPSNDSDRFSLGQLSNVNRNETVKNARSQFGRGVHIFNECGEIYVKCLTDAPVFLQSHAFNQHNNFRSDTVYKIPAHSTVKIFDHLELETLISEADKICIDSVFELMKKCKFRLSWGTGYDQQNVKSTPCHLLIILRELLEWAQNTAKLIHAMNSSSSSLSLLGIKSILDNAAAAAVDDDAAAAAADNDELASVSSAMYVNLDAGTEQSDNNYSPSVHLKECHSQFSRITEWESNLERNDFSNEECVGLIDKSIEENVNPHELYLPMNYSQGHPTKSDHHLPSGQKSNIPILPEFSMPSNQPLNLPTPSNLMPILPEVIGLDVPDLNTLRLTQAPSTIFPENMFPWYYQDFPPPLPYYPFHQ